MKTFSKLVVIASILLAGACNAPSGAPSASDTDSTRITPAPVDNNNATNPSLADTSYPKKDTMETKADSIRKRQ